LRLITRLSRRLFHAARAASGGGAMNEQPGRVLTGPDGIDRLNALIAALDDEEQVRLVLDDGRIAEGVVAVRPTLQVFRDAQGGEGTNALLRLEPLTGDGQARYLWLDTIASVTRLGSA
jgi:Protein of unknown function (DUF3247)